MQWSSLIPPVYEAWTIMAGLVAVLYLRPVLRGLRTERFDNVFWISLGIVLAASGACAHRAWWIVWRYGLDHGWDVAWMVKHAFVPVSGVWITLGLLLHVRTATHQRLGEVGWIATVLAVAAFTFLVPF